MKRLPLFALAISFVLGTPAVAQDADQIDAFISVVTEAGCVITEANNLSILNELGITEDQGSEIVKQLVIDGRAAPDESGLRLTGGDCEQ